MNESSTDHENRSQVTQPSSVSLDRGDQATPQSFPNQDIRTQNTAVAAVSEYEAIHPDPTQNCEAQLAPMSTRISDKARLPKAVVIPQRRPSDRARGFVRAYAPDLLRCGIDQPEFLRFIDGLNRSVASNPAVEAVNLAGEAVGAIPGAEFVGAPILGAALQVAAGAYKEVNARRGQNSYLTKMNNELFRPRGLYCLIMSYDIKSRSNVVRPGQSDSSSHVIREGISSGSNSSRMRNSDGMLGASNFPAVAELIYPDPGDLPESNVEEDSSELRSRSGVWASGQSKIQDMMAAHADKEDLKSQIKFQKKNPTSLINHLMDPKAELSEKDRQKQEKREAEQKKKEEKREREAEKRSRKHPDKAPKVHKPKEVPLKYSGSWFQVPPHLLTHMLSLLKGILYIMIVNIPSAQVSETAYG